MYVIQKVSIISKNNEQSCEITYLAEYGKISDSVHVCWVDKEDYISTIKYLFKRSAKHDLKHIATLDINATYNIHKTGFSL